MIRPVRGLASFLIGALVAWPIAGVAGPAAEDSSDARAVIVHALNRLGYGPRPGDLERVRALGLERWIDQQLHPERIAENDLESRLAALKTIRLSTAEVLREYEIPREARQEIQKKRAQMGENASEEDIRKARQELMEKYHNRIKGTPKDVLDELQAAKVVRAVYSERQLDEVLVDFWFNHFNVYAQKGQDRFLVNEYERKVIRPHAWGKFEGLLKATAESPAMLFYLDNWLSADPNAPQGQMRRFFRPGRFGLLLPRDGMMLRRPRGQGQGRKRGLNENYAREIMELHTLGVDGGYTQKDVTELARVFTGWTIRGLQQQEPEFFFDERIHDRGDKVVLGQVVKDGGKGEGDRMIHLLATHPSTARFVSYKLCRRFVADDPPKALVDSAAQTFLRTDGDIRAVVRTIVTSPEFFGAEDQGVKIKTPLDFVVSAVRATGAQVDDARGLAGRIAEMGMPLYLQQPPTGYKDTAEAWVSTSGLLARLNFALDLAAGKVRGVTVDVNGLAPGAGDADALAKALAARLLPSGLTEPTQQTLEREAGAGLNAVRVAGLILGSPEFQRR